MDQSLARRAIEELGGGELGCRRWPAASFAFLSAVRRAERCARLRTVAARDLRMFFLADAIFGTKQDLQKSTSVKIAECSRSVEATGARWRKSRQDNALTLVGALTTFRADRPSAATHPPLVRVPSHQIRPADVALSGSAALRAGAAVLRDRARDRARLCGTQAGRHHRPDARSADLESDQAHRSVHDDPAAGAAALRRRRTIMLGGAKPVPVNPRELSQLQARRHHRLARRRVREFSHRARVRSCCSSSSGCSDASRRRRGAARRSFRR